MNKEKVSLKMEEGFLEDIVSKAVSEYKSQLKEKIDNITGIDLNNWGIHVRLTNREIKLLKQFLIKKLLGDE